MNVLITGGAGFVGAALATHYKAKFPKSRIVALDNLHRRGSELNVAKFKRLGIEFQHGDIRQPSDLWETKGPFDLFLECSAEPSVLAGHSGSPRYVLDTNLTGTTNCLEFARQMSGQLIFLSTSRVYSMAPLLEIKLRETATRFEISDEQSIPGISERGIAENFPTHLPRSFYGATKLCSEYLVQEYCAAFGMKAVINRFGVIAGPGQFGKVDQGVFTLWVARHFFGSPLKYTGFGGTGKQVRDLLHIEDLVRWIDIQADAGVGSDCQILNVGGGLENSSSLLELTAVCREVTGNSVEIASSPETSSVDIPLYITDFSKARAKYGWQPKKRVADIARDIAQWVKEGGESLRATFA